MSRLQILVNEAALVAVGKSPRDADRQAQEASELHRLIQQPGERLAPGIFAHKHAAPAPAQRPRGPDRPRAVKLAPQAMFVSEAIGACGGWVPRGEKSRQYGLRAAVGARPPSSAKSPYAVLPQ